MCSYALKHLTRSLSRSHTFFTSIIAPLTRPPTTYAINYSQPHSYSTASHHQTQFLSSINPRQNDHPPAQPPDLPPQTHQGDAPPVVATHLPRLDGRARQRALRARPRPLHNLPAGDRAPQEQHFQPDGRARSGWHRNRRDPRRPQPRQPVRYAYHRARERAAYPRGGVQWVQSPAVWE
ncbi:hypothetical protein CBS147352_4684 [Aspergillus niger]|nr:hypothetical protein CBS147352_4684 [Aspergillus niger]